MGDIFMVTLIVVMSLVAFSCIIAAMWSFIA